MLYVTLIIIFISRVSTIWPPAFKVNLNDEETFVISDFVDDLLGDDDEMIKVPPRDDNKYLRIHRMAMIYNKKQRNVKKPARKVTKMKERNFDLDDAVPWEGGFVDEKGNFIQPDNENVYYLNEMAKSLIDDKIKQKREDSETEAETENYDYKEFKSKYNSEIERSKKKDTLNYTDVKEEESVEEVLETIVNFNQTKNCSAELKNGIGVSAIKCIVYDLQTAKSTNSILNLAIKILRITAIWFCVYAAIAIPCWCQRGWCCCCCCCKMCNPRRIIEEAKQFHVQNPVGTFHTKDGGKVEYDATHYEVYAQRRLEKALFSL